MQLEKVQYKAKSCTAVRFGLLSRVLVVLFAAVVSQTAPAAAFAQQPAQAGAQARSAAKILAGESDSIRPFRVNVPQAALDDLRRRITATQWPDKETVTDASQGVQLATIRELARYWTTDYDWRKAEARLNSLPQFITNIGGLTRRPRRVASRPQRRRRPAGRDGRLGPEPQRERRGRTDAGRNPRQRHALLADEHGGLFGSPVLGEQAALLRPETRRHPGRRERLS
jgi:hypothetical protein